MSDQLKYGRIEWERRFLLAAVPDLGPADRTYRIIDRYIPGTRLRLRRMEGDGQVAYKLARKLPPLSAGGGVMGNLYLSEGEYGLLAALEANVVRKTRHYFGVWGLDVFEGPLRGLVLAEAEADDESQLRKLEPPWPVQAEVTANPFFSGARLATATPQELRAEVAKARDVYREGDSDTPWKHP
jgi:CYTH domain-containing protein